MWWFRPRHVTLTLYQGSKHVYKITLKFYLSFRLLLTKPCLTTAISVPLALAKIRIFDVEGKLELKVTFAGNTFPLRGEDPNENNQWRTALQIGMTHIKLTEKNIISMFSEVSCR